MRNKLLLLALALISVAGLSLGGHKAAFAAIDNSPDKDKYAIIWGGAYSEAEFKDKFNNDGHYTDHTEVFEAFGISKSDVSGMQDGVVYKNGDIKVNGKLVATDARQAARNLGGTKIAGTSAAKVSTSVFADNGQTAMVKLDKNGKFIFAIIKSCGNPVNATPKPVPPKPIPPVKNPTAKCTSLGTTLTGNKTVTLTAVATAANGATIKAYKFSITSSDGTVVYTKPVATAAKTASTTTTLTTPGSYTTKVVVSTSEGDKTGSQCEGKFTVKTPPTPTSVFVCNPANGETISVDKKDESKYPSVGSDKCKDIVVCELATKTKVTIKSSAYDASRYSHNLVDCVETPAELPQTGILGGAASFVGIGSVVTASGAYLRSRRATHL